MPSDEHEEIIDDIREILNHVLQTQKQYEEIYMMIDAHIAHPLMGFGKASDGPRADMYILFEDGGGPIVVEVGNMRSGKWHNYLCEEDGKPVRILRVGFDRSIALVNQRFTQFEKDLTQCLQEHLLQYAE